MVGDEIHVGGKNLGDPSAPHARNAGVISLPEPSVMHKDRVGAKKPRLLDELKARGNAGDNMADVPLPLDLKSVWSVVPVVFRMQQIVKGCKQYISVHMVSLKES